MVGPPGSRVLALSGIRHLASGIGRPAARGIVALVACGCAWAAEPARPLAVGETVEVAVDAAAMKVRRQVVAALKRGDRLVVERLWDQWLWSTVGAGGESKSGWVRVDQVRRVGPAAALALDVGDQVAVTAESADVLAAGARIATLPRRYLFVVEAVRQGHVATTVDVGGKPVQGWVSTQRLRRVRPGEELGIEDGDQVWVESPVGRIQLRARLWPGIQPHVVGIPEGQGHTAGGRYAEGHGANPNALLVPELDELSGELAHRATRVRVYKA